MNITVIGLGYVGLVASVALTDAGHEVVGLDIDPDRIRKLQGGRVPFYEPHLKELLEKSCASGRLRFSPITDFQESLGEVVLIAVGTPSLPNGATDLSGVRGSIGWVVGQATHPLTLIMKSTVPPGTGQQMVLQYLSGTDKKVSYVSNPEFLREGNAVSDWFHPDRIVIGATDATAIQKTQAIYDDIKAPVVVTDITTAEMIKYAANAFLATKISFINEMASLCDRLCGNIKDVAHGMGLDPRIGPHFLKAGLGFGGSCFPKDVRGLESISAMYDHSFDLMKAVIHVNNRQRMRPIQALRGVLGTLSGKVIAILGLAFKPDTDDVREAPSIDIIRFLDQEGAILKVFDPVAGKNAESFLPKGVKLSVHTEDAIYGAEALILTTEWEDFVSKLDWRRVHQLMLPPRYIFDGRNALDAGALKAMGFRYQGVGCS